MGRWLRGTTVRGRAVLAAGATATAVAVLAGQRDLLRVGILLLALPLVALLVVSRTRFRLSCTRRVEPGRVAVGDPAAVVLRLENVSRLPTGLVLVEDRLPYTLGSRPRFVLDRVEARGVREVEYPVASAARGRYTVGPLAVTLADPFGMVELVRSFRSTDTLVVTPVVERLPALALGGDWSGSGESRARSVASAGEDDVGTRPYRRGDELRRVHWRSTAKYGELMVRREEQPWESRAIVLLDSRARAHQGEGAVSTFEAAVSAAASIGVHLGRAGFTVDLVTDTGARLSGSVSAEPVGVLASQEDGLLDALSVVEQGRNPSLRPAFPTLRHAGDGLTVAVLGEVDPEEAAEVARARHGSGLGVAVLVSPKSPASSDGDVGSLLASPAAATFRAAGWRVVPLHPGEPLADRWPLAAHGSLALAAGVTA